MNSKSNTGVELEVPLDEAKALVRKLLREQSEVVLNRWSTAKPMTMKDRRDFTTAVDTDVEKAIQQGIRKHFPSHGFAGEELTDEKPSAVCQWLIDPIDGTKYYAGQAHLFSISVGLLVRGVPTLGVVHVPTSGQCFHAAIGHGAYLDDTVLGSSSVESLKEAILNVDMARIDRLSQEERIWCERKLIALTRRAYRVRSLGAGALAACWLATGALDGFVDLTGYDKPQDLAAGRVILAESGIRVEFVSQPVGPARLVAAPIGLWPELSALLSED